MDGREIALITGAGSGIGRELTRLFLADGSRVLAVSLLERELDDLQKDLDPRCERLTTLTMDLSAPDAAERLFAHCEAKGIRVDVLVNNAGFACFGDVVDLDPNRVASMLSLNVVTLTKLSMLFGKQMKGRGRGRILNVGSTAGMAPAMRFASYGGSKSYVNAFTFALRAELAPFGVSITCLTPGAVATNFAKTAQIERFAGKSMLKDMFAKGAVSMPDEIAAAGYRGMRAGHAHVLVGKGAKLAALMARLIPQSYLPRLINNT